MMRGRVISVVELVGMLGEVKALQLCQRFGRGQLPDMERFLHARRKQAILRDYAKGWSILLLMEKYSIDKQYIRRLLKEKYPAARRAKRIPALKDLLDRL